MPGTSPIERANTIDSAFYVDQFRYDLQLEHVFGNSWQFLADRENLLRQPENLYPIDLLQGSLSEPLLISKSEKEIKLLSNVCTHRGMILIPSPTRSKKIVCGYHGRRFNQDGRCEFMPEFKEVENFPEYCDHLHRLPLANFDRFLFTHLGNEANFAAIRDFLTYRLYFLDFSNFRTAPEYDQIYNVRAHWALYVDNYLEGFHIPFVHEALGSMIDYRHYETICEGQVVLQIGYSQGGTPSFELPEGHPDFDKAITAYYYWIYPNFMMNIYPWGVQINIIRPVAIDLTKVEFVYFIKDEKLWQQMGKDGVAEKTEREDEYVVEAVQKGLKSRFYDKGRFSAKRERGVYHFHQLLHKAIPE